MANKYSDALLSAIDIIAMQRVSEAGYDKTVVAEVISKAANNRYTLKYENALIEAFYEGELPSHIMVYVLIPQGDMGEEKQIIGKVNYYMNNDNSEKTVRWQDTLGILVQNNLIIGYIDANNRKVYFNKE